MTKLPSLERTLDYQFQDKRLLQQALTHRSHSAQHNERLEFLGDSVLNFIVASLLYQRFERIDEGDLSRLRANLVKQATLAQIAQGLSLSDYLLLGEGEWKSGGYRRPSILADALEAVFGAVYLDGGFEAAFHVVSHQYGPLMLTVDPQTLGKDPKTLLQEFLQGRRLDLPVYTVIATHGAAHKQVFDVQCAIPELNISVSASGSSRRSAEQLAATEVLAILASLPKQGSANSRTRARKGATGSLPGNSSNKIES